MTDGTSGCQYPDLDRPLTTFRATALRIFPCQIGVGGVEVRRYRSRSVAPRNLPYRIGGEVAPTLTSPSNYHYR